MQYEGFKPACLLQRLYLFADVPDQIQIEILQHGCYEHEHYVLAEKRKRQMRSAEVVVLYVEVLFALSACIVEYDNVFLC